jgi:hypothetical protein
VGSERENQLFGKYEDQTKTEQSGEGDMRAIYNIKGLCPRTDMRNAGFSIDLHPLWMEAVRDSWLNQNNVNTAIQNMHRPWLDGCGYDAVFDPDNCGAFADKTKPAGPDSRPLYDIHSIRVKWGAWGPEHITVPGDACGLDISNAMGGFVGGKSLHPHNVDTIRQAHLLLVVFTFFADTLVMSELERERATKGQP